MPDNNSVRNSAITSDERIRNALRRVIRKSFDTHQHTRASLAEVSGVNIHQIDAIMSRDPAKHRRVAAEDALCLAYELEAVGALAGLVHHTAQHRDCEAETKVSQIVASGLQAFSTIATAAADGRIDHTEAPACQDAADQLIATVLPLSSAGRAQ